MTLFHDVRISIPNWKPSPNRRISQIAFPITVPPKDDRTDSVRGAVSTKGVRLLLISGSAQRVYP